MIYLLAVGIFILAFLGEVTLCLYTRAVIHKDVLMATLMTAACRILASIGVLSYVNKPILLLPLLAGETLATYLVMSRVK